MLLSELGDFQRHFKGNTLKDSVFNLDKASHIIHVSYSYY